MRVLAIDPGNTMSAWCEFENGKIRRSDKVANEIVLRGFRADFTSTWIPEIVAIEMIASYGMAVGKEVFDTCMWVGRFIEAADARGIYHRLVYRKDVKLHLCQTVRANDANIRAAIIDRYGPGKEKAIGTKKAPGPLYGLKGDEWAALAVALTIAG